MTQHEREKQETKATTDEAPALVTTGSILKERFIAVNETSSFACG